jgi:hypothetical protein
MSKVKSKPRKAIPATNIATYREGEYLFGINPLGEVFRNNEDVFGSVNIGNLCRELGLKPGRNPPPEAVAYEFERMAHAALNYKEYAFYKKVSELQTLNNDRFWVHGGIRGKKESVVLVTEFRNFSDQKEFFVRFHSARGRSGCRNPTYS